MNKIHLEVSLNQIIGLFGGWLIVYLSQPILSDFKPESVATYYSIVFFIWSYARSYVIRCFFENNKLH